MNTTLASVSRIARTTPVLRYSEEPGQLRAKPGSSPTLQGYLRTGVRSAHRAFTLIELMISIALVLILILGVNQVFTYTTQAVGAGEAINAAIRSSRATQYTFSSDFSGIVANGTGTNDAAYMYISSRAYYAFNDAKDQASLGNLSGSAPTSLLPSAAFEDLNGDSYSGDPTVPGEVVYPSTYNRRNHRLDVMSFFSRGFFHRQTGNPGVMVDDMASQEAWVWYGHLQLPNNSDPSFNPYGSAFPNQYFNTSNSQTNSTFPCMGNSSTNPNNYFGSKLVLGRYAMLLKYTNGAALYDSASQQQWSLPGPNPFFTATKLNQTPASTIDGYGQNYCLSSGRVDVGDTSISQFQKYFIGSAIDTTVPFWWEYLMGGNQTPPTSTQGNFTANGHGNYTRFMCNPFVVKPMQSWNMAQASPYFVGGCSQFIVEFAGDFLKQDNDPTHTTRSLHSAYGDVNGPGSDGEMDYVFVNGQKQIAWYGMPRSTSGNSTISWKNGDVTPLRDRFYVMYDATTGAAITEPLGYDTLGTPSSPRTAMQENGFAAAGYPTFEKYGPLDQQANYGAGNMTSGEANTGYTCAFGPNDPHPKLIRITMTLDDPTGRLPQGQTYQYVFPVP